MDEQIQTGGGANRPPNGLAIAGFISAFFCGIVGLILSIKARGQIKASGGAQGGWGFTTGGIIVSIVGLAIAVIYLTAVIITVVAEQL
jgi:hypothetical protein